jgi:hypothetical protein
MLASGMTEDEVLTEYAYLEKADFQPSEERAWGSE